MNFFYKWLMTSKANGLYFELESMIETINQYDLVNGPIAETSQYLHTNDE